MLFLTVRNKMNDHANVSAMTFYNEQITKISKDIYPKDYLIRQVIQAKHFIDKHFADNINLNHIAEKAFLSKFHFIRLFKSCYGSTPYQYLTSVRIENAKRLLKSDSAISETCFAVGFASVTWFTGLFRKMTGVTPAAFKKKKR
jgi:AraC-like DNA-binding protein